MTWHGIEKRRPEGIDRAMQITPTAVADYVEALEEGIGHLLEVIENLDRDKVKRFWPEYEGYAATLTDSAGCQPWHVPGRCWHCEPATISAAAADWIDPDGEKPEGWPT